MYNVTHLFAFKLFSPDRIEMENGEKWIAMFSWRANIHATTSYDILINICRNEVFHFCYFVCCVCFSWSSWSDSRMKNQMKFSPQKQQQQQQLWKCWNKESAKLNLVHRLLDDISFHFIPWKFKSTLGVEVSRSPHVQQPVTWRQKAIIYLLTVCCSWSFWLWPTFNAARCWRKPEGITEFVQHFSSRSSLLHSSFAAVV